MARSAAARQSDAAAATPIGREEARRAHILGDNDRASGGARLWRRSEKGGENPIPDILEIAGARPKMFVIGPFVAGDLAVQRLSPALVGARARFDHRERGLGQGFVLQHRDLESEDIPSFAIGCSGQFGELGDRRRDRTSQRALLNNRPTAAALPGVGVKQHGYRACGKAGRSSAPDETKLSHPRSRIDPLQA